MTLALAQVTVPTFLPVEDGRIAYRDTGPHPDGRPTLVLLHGGAVDGRMWSRQIGPLSARHRVVVPDARGHGASSTPGPQGYRPHADLAALLEHLDAGPVALVGLSMGARVAFDTALERPDLVDRVVLCGAGAGEPVWTDPWTVDTMARWEQARLDLDAERWVRVFLEFVPGPFRTEADVDPAVLAEIRLMAVDLLSHHLPADPAAPPGPIGFLDDAAERAGAFPVPLLGLVGALDSDDHRRIVADTVAAVPDGSPGEIGGTAHYPNMERPPEFERAVLDFVSR
ncbi:alpha/beta fold hydrolase [Pseudonocardia alni]|uniref:Pimeloyl-ACP methyl ester carboxylesterase n=1 Tax=Pseudonocardia alni TaxID=33907 RepID=A0AA44UPV8_PSEA5|nr:alpha/beta hydrolase [Pseudonocardia alni]PKB31397.1 pimeloyl-ACP methyl ester carboxylesterase [Pseudonocardia alni]